MIIELGLVHLIHRLVLLWSESLIEVAHLAHLGCHHHGRREARRRRRREGGGNLFWDGFTAKAGSALAARGAAGGQAGRQAGRTAVRGWLTDPGALHCNWPDHLQDWGCSVRHHPIIILGIFFKATYP